MNHSTFKRLVAFFVSVVLVLSSMPITIKAKASDLATPSDAEGANTFKFILVDENEDEIIPDEWQNIAGIQYGLYSKKDTSTEYTLETFALSYDGRVYVDEEGNNVVAKSKKQIKKKKLTEKEFSYPEGTYYYRMLMTTYSKSKDNEKEVSEFGYKYDKLYYKLKITSDDKDREVKLFIEKDEKALVATPSDATKPEDDTTTSENTTEAAVSDTEEAADNVTEEETQESTQEATSEVLIPGIDPNGEEPEAELFEADEELSICVLAAFDELASLYAVTDNKVTHSKQIYGNTYFYTVTYTDNDGKTGDYAGWCAEPELAALVETNSDNLIFDNLNNDSQYPDQLRTAMYYDYTKEPTWSGWSNMSISDKVNAMHYTLAYYYNNKASKYKISGLNAGYINYIEGLFDREDEDKIVRLGSAQTKITFTNTKTGTKVDDISITGSNVEKITELDDKPRLVTDTHKFNSNRNNYAYITAPGGSGTGSIGSSTDSLDRTILHYKKNGSSRWEMADAGEKVKLENGDLFYFSAPIGKSNYSSYRVRNLTINGRPGCSVYEVEKKDDTNHNTQHILFATKSDSDSATINVTWESVPLYISMAKNINTGSTSIGNITYTSRYGINQLYTPNGIARNSTNITNYNMAGIAYKLYYESGRRYGSDIRDQEKDGNVRGIFVASYNGEFYQNRNNKQILIFTSKSQLDTYIKTNGANSVERQTIKVPSVGKYYVMEADRLYKIENDALVQTGSLPRTTGYYKNTDNVYIDVTDLAYDDGYAKKNYTVDIDKPVTGALSLNKSDYSTGEPLAEAEFTVYKGTTASGTVMGRFITNSDGVGVVSYAHSSLIRSGDNGGTEVGSTVLKGLPLGSYLIRETAAPRGYTKLTHDATLTITTENSTLRYWDYSSNAYTTTEVNRTSATNYENPLIANYRVGNKKSIKLDPIVLEKTNAEDVDNEYGYSGSFDGAIFEICYYEPPTDDYVYTKDNLPSTATRTWQFKTINGIIDLNDARKYVIADKSSEFYIDEDTGKIGIPRGGITIREVKAPEGYKVEDAKIRYDDKFYDVGGDAFFIWNFGDLGTTNMIQILYEDQPIRGDINFSKIAITTNDEEVKLADCVFEVENLDTNVKVTIKTDENGNYDSSTDDNIWFGNPEAKKEGLGKLVYGSYVLREQRCDANKNKYKNIEDIYFEITKDGENITLSNNNDGEIENHSIRIHTTAQDTRTYSKSVSSVEEIQLTDTVELNGLEVGHKYTLYSKVMIKDNETQLTSGGKPVENKVDFVATATDAFIDVPFTFTIDDVEDISELVCFEFLTDEAYPDEVMASEADYNNEDQTVKVVKIGTKASGLEGSKEIALDKTITVKDICHYKGLTPGEKYRMVGVLYDKKTGLPYEVNDEQVTAYKEFTCDKEEGDIEMLFEFTVTEAIKRKEFVVFEYLYYDDSDIELAIHADIESEDQTVVIVEKPVYISKKDATTGEELAGASLVLTDDKGKTIESWVSTNEPHVITGLLPGKYILTETTAPLGYLLSEQVEFEITKDSVKQVVEMKDSYAIVAISKIDAVTKEPLADAEFTLYDAETDEKVAKATSNEDGYAEFIKVAPGNYYIKETSFPDGYTVDLSNKENKVSVTVEKNQYTNVAPIIMKNQYSRVAVKKVDADTGETLAGATFTLYDSKGKEVAKAKSGKDGFAEFTDVVPGIYTIKETAAPKGYQISDDEVSVDTTKTNFTLANPIIMRDYKEDTEETPEKPNTPLTGDNAPIVIFIIIFALSIIGGIILLLTRKKRTK